MLVGISGNVWGVTVYKGQAGFGKNGTKTDILIVYTVITRLELNKLNTELEKIDPDAFVVMSSVKDTKGGMKKKDRISIRVMKYKGLYYKPPPFGDSL